MEASAKRDLQEAIWRSSGGFDLVLAPVLLALFGLWIDSMAGTRPLFMLGFLAFGTVGAVLKVYYDFQRGMEAAAAQTAEIRAETERLRAEAREAAAGRAVPDLTTEISSELLPTESARDGATR